MVLIRIISHKMQVYNLASVHGVNNLHTHLL